MCQPFLGRAVAQLRAMGILQPRQCCKESPQPGAAVAEAGAAAAAA